MNVFSIEFGGIHSGFLIALLDALVFAASAVFTFLGGRMTAGGYDVFFAVLLAIATWSLLTTVLFLRGEARAPARATNSPD